MTHYIKKVKENPKRFFFKPTMSLLLISAAKKSDTKLSVCSCESVFSVINIIKWS